MIGPTGTVAKRTRHSDSECVKWARQGENKNKVVSWWLKGINASGEMYVRDETVVMCGVY